MKAIFTGKLEDGFALKQVVRDEEAEDLVIRLMANGVLAEALEVQDPSVLDKRVMGDPDGEHFVVYGQGLGNGFSVFGPFADSDEAHDFAEDNRDEGEEWELFERQDAIDAMPVPDIHQLLEDHPEIHIEQAKDGKWTFRHDDNEVGPDDQYFAKGSFNTKDEAIIAAFDEYGVEFRKSVRVQPQSAPSIRP